MANCITTTLTNRFRVTDEHRYSELFANLCCLEDSIQDFTENEDGIVYHGFGAYDSIDYLVFSCGDNCEYDWDEFIAELQKILPDDEVFVYMETTHEKLRYLDGFVLVVTNKDIVSMSLENWAKTQAKLLLGNDFKIRF